MDTLKHVICISGQIQPGKEALEEARKNVEAVKAKAKKAKAENIPLLLGPEHIEGFLALYNVGALVGQCIAKP